VQLHRDRKKFDATGVNLVMIGHGTVAQARDFKQSRNIDVQLLVDSKRRAYKEAGTKMASLSDLFGPTVVLKGIASAAKLRTTQGRTIGNAAQLGGVLVVTPDGRVTYAHIADDASDNPPNEEVLEAAADAAASA
jgi:hypothetical protein